VLVVVLIEVPLRFQSRALNSHHQLRQVLVLNWQLLLHHLTAFSLGSLLWPRGNLPHLGRVLRKADRRALFLAFRRAAERVVLLDKRRMLVDFGRGDLLKDAFLWSLHCMLRLFARQRVGSLRRGQIRGGAADVAFKASYLLLNALRVRVAWR